METITKSETATKLDQLETMISQCEQPHVPIIHRFTPGLYIREMQLPAGALLTTMKHCTEHPFVLSKGRLHVSSENEGTVIYEAPFCGITLPGTRRAMFAETEVVWTTFHATSETDVEKIGEMILEPNDNLPANYDIGWKRSLPKHITE
jgi:hypothetical protein